MDLVAGAEGLLGALIGAIAAVGGIVLDGRLRARRQEAEAHRCRVQAARAWRDDLYEVETALAKAYQSGGRPDLRRALRSRMGTDTTFLELAAAIGDGDQWWKVARGRRDLVELLEIRHDDRRWKRRSIHHFFWRLEAARVVIATTDEEWPAVEHTWGAVMRPRPGEGPSHSLDQRQARD